jgi:CoA:oxalate CoA-transferase
MMQAANSEAGLAIGIVRDTQELGASQWAKEWGAVTEIDDRANGVVRMPGPPWRFSRSTLPPPGIPAYQGEHNAEILTERHIEPVVIEDLRQRRVVLSRRTPRGTYD